MALTPTLWLVFRLTLSGFKPLTFRSWSGRCNHLNTIESVTPAPLSLSPAPQSVGCEKTDFRDTFDVVKYPVICQAFWCRKGEGSWLASEKQCDTIFVLIDLLILLNNSKIDSTSIELSFHPHCQLFLNNFYNDCFDF